MIRHYEGILGVFDYDDEEFCLEKDDVEWLYEDANGVQQINEYLCYIGRGNSVSLPRVVNIYNTHV